MRPGPPLYAPGPCHTSPKTQRTRAHVDAEAVHPQHLRPGHVLKRLAHRVAAAGGAVQGDRGRGGGGVQRGSDRQRWQLAMGSNARFTPLVRCVVKPAAAAAAAVQCFPYINLPSPPTCFLHVHVPASPHPPHLMRSMSSGRSSFICRVSAAAHVRSGSVSAARYASPASTWGGDGLDRGPGAVRW